MRSPIWLLALALCTDPNIGQSKCPSISYSFILPLSCTHRDRQTDTHIDYKNLLSQNIASSMFSKTQYDPNIFFIVIKKKYTSSTLLTVSCNILHFISGPWWQETSVLWTSWKAGWSFVHRSLWIFFHIDFPFWKETKCIISYDLF